MVQHPYMIMHVYDLYCILRYKSTDSTSVDAHKIHNVYVCRCVTELCLADQVMCICVCMCDVCVCMRVVPQLAEVMV